MVQFFILYRIGMLTPSINYFLHLFSHDVLILRDGFDSSILAILTGNSIPAPIRSTGNTVFIEFLSDETHAQNGFRFEYKACKYCLIQIWHSIG